LDSPIDSAVRFGPANFTFRGDPRDPMLGTASVWTELNGLSWHNRAADVIMLGRDFLQSADPTPNSSTSNSAKTN